MKLENYVTRTGYALGWYGMITLYLHPTEWKYIELSYGQLEHWYNPLKWILRFELDIRNKDFDIHIGVFYFRLSYVN